MDYNLNSLNKKEDKYLTRLFQSAKELGSYLNKRRLSYALLLVVLSSIAQIVTPYLLGLSIDTFIARGDLRGLSRLIFALSALYVVSGIITYFQQRIMGKVGQQALYKLRATIFEKIQSLPIAFFNQNKTGDLMSRINNDTDKLSQFLSESILRFAGSAFTLLGITGFILYLNWKLALVLLASTLFLLSVTRIFSPYLEKYNKKSSAALGIFTAGVSEQLTNFKAIVAFDRRNFFETFLSALNKDVYNKSILAAFLNTIFSALYDFAGYIAQVAVLGYGIYLISHSEITIGLLIGFLSYTLRFYDPLRFIAAIFGNIQVSLASWGRIRDILSLTSNLPVIKEGSVATLSVETLMYFDEVNFKYAETNVLKHVTLGLQKGKTYALVGPTGGGKSTIASLMVRLYDPTAGVIFWKGKDMRTYDRDELSTDISVILQEPFLFTGSVADNIRYGNDVFFETTDEQLEQLLEERNMSELLKRFPDGLKTNIDSGAENISIGQKQIISFVRTVLRAPKLLILDEATANIDTVTESSLQKLIESLPKDTTKIIIAHRLNTIKKADEILFVGGGEVKRVSGENEVLELLRASSKK